MKTRRAVSAVLLAFMLSASVACGSAQQDLAAGILGLQSAVIADGQSGGLPPKDEAKILNYLTQVESAIAAQQNGWQASVKSIWQSALKDIPAADQTKYAVLIGAISGAIAQL